jgi:hypothetical protein
VGLDPDTYAWDAWQPVDAHRRLANVAAPWCVAAGWAVDLFLGGGLREHSDLEIAAPAARFAEVLAALPELEFFALVDRRARSVEEGEPVLRPPSHQTWGLDRPAGVWRIDVFREPSDGDTWLCRRDETIRLPYGELIEHTAAGIPYVRPEIALLFQAKHALPKDDADLAAALAVLEPERCAYLAELIERVHPGHRWLESIKAGT